MLIAEGSRVKLIHTGDEGVVTKILGDGLVNILLDNEDMEIPAFEEDIISIEADRQAQSNKTPIKAKVLPGKQDKTPQAPILPDPASQYNILKSLGIQLVFDPNYREDRSTSSYDIYLINDTKYDVLYSFKLQLKYNTLPEKNAKLSAMTSQLVDTLSFDQLNDAPSIAIDLWQVTTAGTSKKRAKVIKVKPQQFFRKVKTAPILNRPVHWYSVVESFDDNQPTKQGEDLQTYTKRKARPVRKTKSSYTRSSNSLEAFANFNLELDLHLEKITDTSQKRSNAEILRIQLYKFDQYLSEAIQLGVERVFIIHGMGKGRLKNEIASRLINNPDVTTFKNEFHPKYGFGATEVII